MLGAEARRRRRQSLAKPVCDAFYEWIVVERKLVSESSAIAKALDCSVKQWEALTGYLDDGLVPIDNNKRHAAIGTMLRIFCLAVAASDAGIKLARSIDPRAANKKSSALCRDQHNRRNWLFAGSLRAGQRAAAIMSLIRSAQLNGHDPHAYLKNILTRLPAHRESEVETLLPHRW